MPSTPRNIFGPECSYDRTATAQKILEKLMMLAVYGPLQFISQELHRATIVIRVAEDSQNQALNQKICVDASTK